MSDKTKVKYISDVDIDDTDVLVKKPFKVQKENKRRFVRVEISAPVSMRNLKDNLMQITDDEIYSIEGTIFNISANGVLVEMQEKVSEKDFVLMKFTIQDVETLDSVLGVVKRIDTEDTGNLVGIEFLSPGALKDRLSKPEIELLQENISNFNDSIHDTLEKYFYKK